MRKNDQSYQDAFKIIFDSGKFEITSDWLMQYDLKIRAYNNLDWFYALTKRLAAYRQLVKYTNQVYPNAKKNGQHLISSPTKTPIPPQAFLNFLGKPEPENVDCIITQIFSIYVSYRVIQESDEEKFIAALRKETIEYYSVEYERSSTEMSPKILLKPEKHKYDPNLIFSISNEKIHSMIKTIKSLSRSGKKTNSPAYKNALRNTHFIENECDSKKTESFAAELSKCFVIKFRSECIRERAYHNDRIQLLSTCVDIITGGILKTNHDIRKDIYGGKSVDYITDQHEHMFYLLPENIYPAVTNLYTQDIINSIKLHSTEDVQETIKEKWVEEDSDPDSNICQYTKQDTFGRTVYNGIYPFYTTGRTYDLLTAGWLKEFDSKNKEKLASAWCNVVLMWPDDIIIDNFTAWLKKTKAQHTPRKLSPAYVTKILKHTNKKPTEIINNKLLQYLDTKILSAVMGVNLSFSTELRSNKYSNDLTEIVEKKASAKMNKLLKEIFDEVNNPSVIDSFRLQSGM